MSNNEISTLKMEIEKLKKKKEASLDLVRHYKCKAEYHRDEQHKAVDEIEKLKRENKELNILNSTLGASQIACDCMVGGECEGEDNCANGMRILKLKEENEKLKKEIEKLKEPVINDRDARCFQLDIRVGYGYVSEKIHEVLTLLECEEIDVDNLPDVVYNEVAKTIESSINSYIFDPELPEYVDIQEYIREDVDEKVEELKEQGLLKEETTEE